LLDVTLSIIIRELLGKLIIFVLKH